MPIIFHSYPGRHPPAPPPTPTGHVDPKVPRRPPHVPHTGPTVRPPPCSATTRCKPLPEARPRRDARDIAKARTTPKTSCRYTCTVGRMFLGRGVCDRGNLTIFVAFFWVQDYLAFCFVQPRGCTLLGKCIYSGHVLQIGGRAYALPWEFSPLPPERVGGWRGGGGRDNPPYKGPTPCLIHDRIEAHPGSPPKRSK